MAHHRIIVLYGQSLAIGARGQPLMNSTAINLCMTFVGGPRTLPVSQTALGPLFEVIDVGADLGETMCSSVCKATNELLVASGRDPVHFFSFAPGEGDQTIAALSKGGPFYTRMMQGVQNAFNLLTAAGHTVSVDAMLFFDGEADAAAALDNPTRIVWKNAGLTLHNDFETDCKVITGQPTPVYMIVGQTNRPRAPNGRNIVMAQIDMSLENSRIIFAGSMSQVGGIENMGNGGADTTHKSGIGYVRQGLVFAVALFRLLCNKMPAPMIPDTAWAVGLTVYVRFKGPFKPKINKTDIVNGLVMTNLGLRVVDASTVTNAISNIRIEKGLLAMDVTRAVEAGSILRFARDYTLGPYLVNAGAMTNIASSMPHRVNLTGTPENILEMAPAYEIDIST